MELFDVLDVNRNYLGYTKKRGEDFKDNEFNQGVEIWIFNNHKLLMTKRSLNKSHPGEWETPGGCSQSGETSLETLIREVNEEIGVSIRKEDVTFIATQLYKHQFVDVYKSEIIVDLEKVKLQEEEVSDIKFVTKEEFLQMASNNKVVKYVYNSYEMIKDEIKDEW